MQGILMDSGWKDSRTVGVSVAVLSAGSAIADERRLPGLRLVVVVCVEVVACERLLLTLQHGEKGRAGSYLKLGSARVAHLVVQSAVLLGTKNELTNPASGSVLLDRYLKALQERLLVILHDCTSISTANGFKQRQCDVGIILDAMACGLPLTYSTWTTNRVLYESKIEIVDESRHLFYMALTCDKHTTYVSDLTVFYS